VLQRRQVAISPRLLASEAGTRGLRRDRRHRRASPLRADGKTDT
jgi:hypothetical protein